MRKHRTDALVYAEGHSTTYLTCQALKVRGKLSRLEETRGVWQPSRAYDARLNPAPTADTAGQITTTQRLSENQMAGLYRCSFPNLDAYIVIT